MGSETVLLVSKLNLAYSEGVKGLLRAFLKIHITGTGWINNINSGTA